MSSKSDHDLTLGILGTYVPQDSRTITWRDGHVTVLPTVYRKSGENVCEDVDIPTIEFMAKFPISTPDSQHVIHLPFDSLQRDDVLEFVGKCLSKNKSVLIRGDRQKKYSKILNADFLEKHFAISEHRPVCIHGTRGSRQLCSSFLINCIDVMLRSFDHVNPKTSGTIKSFFDAMTDSTRIQCILDLPIAQVSLPEPLRWVVHVSRLLHHLIEDAGILTMA